MRAQVVAAFLQPIQAGVSPPKLGSRLRQLETRVWQLTIDDMVIDLEEKGPRLLAFIAAKWPDGKVFYTLDQSVTAHPKHKFYVTQFKKACEEWSTVANVSFHERGKEKGYLQVRKGLRNRASVGYAESARLFEIADWQNHIVIAHELGHALGMTHEHNRSDRDEFVTIEWENIVAGHALNFELNSNSKNYSEYDFQSIMHYGPYAFAKVPPKPIDPKSPRPPRKPTIRVNQDHEEGAKDMGQRKKLSALDRADMASHYGTPI